MPRESGKTFPSKQADEMRTNKTSCNDQCQLSTGSRLLVESRAIRSIHWTEWIKIRRRGSATWYAARYLIFSRGLGRVTSAIGRTAPSARHGHYGATALHCIASILLTTKNRQPSFLRAVKLDTYVPAWETATVQTRFQPRTSMFDTHAPDMAFAEHVPEPSLI
jgi:hypothetical protein